MRTGFDTPQIVTNFINCLVADGYNFVCRYYNVNNPSKNLTLPEAQALSAAGLGIVAVWENGFPTSGGYFSYAKGESDGANAYNYAQNTIGQPAGTPIYFAVDYDASTPDLNNGIIPYFQGIADAFNTAGNAYPVGVYGSGYICSHLAAGNLVTFTWLAQSRGWSGSGNYTDYNIDQLMQKTICGGLTGDPDQSPNENEGSFTVPADTTA